MYRRPLLRTQYEQDAAIFPTWFQKVALGLVILFFVLATLGAPGIEAVPKKFLGNTWIDPVSNMMPLLIAALGFNILVGVAGQVSLGHAFFMGTGAYTAVTLGGGGDGGIKACVPWHDELGLLEEAGQCGLGLPMWIWLPLAGIVAAIIGLLVAPAAVKVRGLYLAIATVGLVFIGLHLGRTFPEFAGDFESGRRWPKLQFRIWKEETPLVDFTEDGQWFGLIHLAEEQKQLFLLMTFVGIFALMSKNLIRSRTGRALQAIRDRDIAAEVMGVPEFKYKRLAFAISSFYAGIGGALFASYLGRVSPVDFSLILSVDFVAILLIGGAGTMAGTVLGTVFVELLPEVVETFTEWLSDQLDGSGPASWLANVLLTSGSGDFGAIATAAAAPGWPMSVHMWNFAIFGVLIVVFMIFEPLGLFGIWLRIRNYWKSWPFSY
ncbi:MAG: branched-chain amino acid ABC transporter permease [Actinomycetia bacterium]|nr:branched-chain amino acid ABC transporter permease [Actinomycetes bacterium]MCP4959460.1 branched-chain amino acid ABC transporter permease [Actinomycetes bacterium]